jgi:hypothetical protein
LHHLLLAGLPAHSGIPQLADIPSNPPVRLKHARSRHQPLPCARATGYWVQQLPGGTI